jgi:hypothetical protein
MYVRWVLSCPFEIQILLCSIMFYNSDIYVSIYECVCYI